MVGCKVKVGTLSDFFFFRDQLLIYVLHDMLHGIVSHLCSFLELPGAGFPLQQSILSFALLVENIIIHHNTIQQVVIYQYERIKTKCLCCSKWNFCEWEIGAHIFSTTGKPFG